MAKAEPRRLGFFVFGSYFLVDVRDPTDTPRFPR